MKRSILALGILSALVACGGSTSKNGADAARDTTPSDVPILSDGQDEDGASDRGPADLGPADTGIGDPGPADLGPEDVGVPDPGPQDLAPLDPGPPDLGPQDLGPQTDPGPELTETAAACVYVIDNICAKAVTKCDLLGLIPSNWMTSCTDFLLNNNAIIIGGCNTLDNASSTDPNVQLIQSMGPLMLQQCIDNFECTLENGVKLYNVMQPIIGGQKIDTGQIVALVAGLCFK